MSNITKLMRMVLILCASPEPFSHSIQAHFVSHYHARDSICGICIHLNSFLSKRVFHLMKSFLKMKKLLNARQTKIHQIIMRACFPGDFCANEIPFLHLEIRSKSKAARLALRLHMSHALSFMNWTPKVIDWQAKCSLFTCLCLECAA